MTSWVLSNRGSNFLSKQHNCCTTVKKSFKTVEKDSKHSFGALPRLKASAEPILKFIVTLRLPWNVEGLMVRSQKTMKGS